MLRWLKDRFWPRLRKTHRRWREDDGGTLVASVAYYAAFSLFPLLLILISVLGFVLRFSSQAQDAQQQLVTVLARNTSPALAQHVDTALAEVRARAVVSGPLGLLTLLFGAIGIFVHVEKAFNRIWDVDDSGPKGVIAAVRNVLGRRLRAFLMLAGLGFLLLVAFVAGIAASAIQAMAIEVPGGELAWNLFHAAASAVLNWLLFTTIYKIAPKPHVRWTDAMRGGLLAAVAWEACRQLLALLVVGHRYSAYGVVGSLIVLMVWLYIAISVLLIGAEYVRVIWDERQTHSG